MKQVMGAVIMLAAMMGTPCAAQDSDEFQTGDYLANTSPQNNARPLIGLVRRADSLAMNISFISDSRDALTRKEEIHAMLRSALDKAKASGFEFATGNPVLRPVTIGNYQDIGLGWAGREDTSKADVLIKLAMGSNEAETQKRIIAFIGGLERKGRGTISFQSGRLLVVSNPGQYRFDIMKLIAQDARRSAEIFGPEYSADINGIDKNVAWAQLNGTDVFLYLPYAYRITAK